jgi:energy-coupling factor transport system ATP-binding protein
MKADAQLEARPTLLSTRGVHVWYERGLPGEQHALRGVELEVRRGDRVGLLGASGSGKSTLLHVLARLQTPRQGRVHSESSLLPSLVFQFPERQLFAETVAEDVGYGLSASGVAKPQVEERVVQALDEVGLDAQTFAPRAPFHLSAGERRRVALAGILAQRRDVVLLDEPTLGLDEDGTQRLIGITEAMHERNVAYWMASHDTDFVAVTCTHLVVLVAGRVAYDGPAEEYWALPERATSHGIRPPHVARLAARLRAFGVSGLSTRSDAAQIAAALAGVRHKHDLPG